MLIDFRTLWPKYNIHPTGVLHVGANVGEEREVYRELGVDRQIWIEANPAIFQILGHNLSNNPLAIAYNFAAGDENKLVDLHISSNASQSSSVLELGNHKEVHPDVHYIGDVSVPMMRLDNFKFRDCDFLNLDIQGFEGNVLRGMGTLLDQFKWIYTEINSKETYLGCMQLPELDEFLSQRGFKRVETFNNGGFLDRLGWSDALYVKN